jgi:hypothetical protein
MLEPFMICEERGLPGVRASGPRLLLLMMMHLLSTCTTSPILIPIINSKDKNKTKEQHIRF